MRTGRIRFRDGLGIRQATQILQVEISYPMSIGGSCIPDVRVTKWIDATPSDAMTVIMRHNKVEK
jgi:hypothetical protein